MTSDQAEISKVLGQMYLYYVENRPKFAVVSELPPSFEGLFAIADNVNNTVGAQTIDTKGFTKEKGIAKNSLGNVGYEVASGIFAWAKKTGNIAVREQVNIPPTYLGKLGDKLIGPACRNIHNLAIANAGELVAFGVDAQSILQLDAAIKTFDDILAIPRKKAIDKKSNTTKLNALFAAVNELLNDTIDKLMVKIKKTDPVLYAGYLAARKMPPSPQKGVPPAPPTA